MVIVIASSTAIYFQITKDPPKDLDQFFNDELWGRKFYTEDELSKRERDASDELEKDPKSAYWYERRASARWSLKNYEGAEADYDRAIELEPNNPDALGARAALRGYDQKYKEALADVNKAISISPKDGWLYITRADIYKRMDKFDAALKDLDKSLSLDGDKRDVFSTQGEIYVKMDRFDKAIDSYENAVKYRKPRRSDDSFDELVRLYISCGRLIEAQDACRKWVRDPAPPDDAFEFSANISKALADKVGETEAYRSFIKHLTEKIQSDPVGIDNYETRAQIYEKLSEPDKARFDYLEVLENSDLKPKDGVFEPWQLAKFSRLFDRVGRTDRKLELYKAAIARYNAKIKQSPKDKFLYLKRAQIYAAMGNNKAASSDFNASWALGSTDQIANAWSRFALREKQYDLALMLRQDLLYKSNPISYANLAEVWEAKGDHAKALDAAKTALALDRFLPDAYYWMGKARAGQGHIEESKKRLQQATAFGYDQEAKLEEIEEDEDD